MPTIDPFSSILSLGQRIRSGELNAELLTEFYLDRIARLDHKLGAFVEVLSDRALMQARRADLELAAGIDRGVLHGIPYAVKDLYDVSGVPTRAGTPILDANVPDSDAFIVDRLDHLGAVLVGKTHTVQFAYGGVGVNSQLGTPMNPWSDTHHIPGGSSSGSGVAVGAGMIPMALGSDTGGSVRIPAAFNSVTGLKTTVGQISRRGVFPLSWTLDTVGPLTRDVSDALAIYPLMAVRDDDDPSMAAFQSVRENTKNLSDIRLAYVDTIFLEGCDPEVEAFVEMTQSVFEKIVGRVEQASFDVAKRAVELNPKGLVIAAEAYYSNRNLIDQQFDKLDPVVAHRLIKGRDVTASEYIDIQNGLNRVRTESLQFFDRFDAFIVPTVMISPPPLSSCEESIQSYATINVQCLRNTAIGNMLNLSAVTVPCGFTKKGLPVGLMVYGKPFDEMKILEIANAFQSNTDWHLNRPDLSWCESK